jgi:hypothetical protein
MAGAQSVSGARPGNISATGPNATQEKEPPYGSHWKTMPRALDLTGSRHRYQHFLMLPLFLVLMHSV